MGHGAVVAAVSDATVAVSVAWIICSAPLTIVHASGNGPALRRCRFVFQERPELSDYGAVLARQRLQFYCDGRRKLPCVSVSSIRMCSRHLVCCSCNHASDCMPIQFIA